MPDKPQPNEPETLACEVCLTEIPASVAKNEEANDYAHHFCGLKCYTQWKDRNSGDPSPDN